MKNWEREPLRISENGRYFYFFITKNNILTLPKRQLDDIIEMIYALDNIAPGLANDDTLLYGVEVKFYNSNVNVAIKAPQVAKIYENEFNQMYFDGKYHVTKEKNNLSKTNIKLNDDTTVSVYFSPANKTSFSVFKICNVTFSPAIPAITAARLYFPASKDCTSL